MTSSSPSPGAASARSGDLAADDGPDLAARINGEMGVGLPDEIQPGRARAAPGQAGRCG